MTWLKGTWAALAAAILAALAIFASARHKQNARKWQETAVDIEKGKVKKGTLTAEAASTKAKLHDAKADEIIANHEKRTKEKKDETTTAILSRWGVKPDPD